MEERSSHWLRCKAVLIDRRTRVFLKVSGWAGLNSPPQRLRCILLLPTLFCGVRGPSWLSAIGTTPLGRHFLNILVIVSIVSILVAIIWARGFLFRRRRGIRRTRGGPSRLEDWGLGCIFAKVPLSESGPPPLRFRGIRFFFPLAGLFHLFSGRIHLNLCSQRPQASCTSVEIPVEITTCRLTVTEKDLDKVIVGVNQGLLEHFELCDLILVVPFQNLPE